MVDPQWTSRVAETVHPYSDQDEERAELARRMRGNAHYAMAMRLFLREANDSAVRALLKRSLIDVLHEERFALAHCPIPIEYSVL